MATKKAATAPSIPGLLRHARYTYGDVMRAELAAAGFNDIPKNGLYLIGGLAQGRGKVPLAQLIADLRISKQLAGQLVENLVSRDYLTRTQDENDRRRFTIALSERGKAAAAVQARARNRVDAALARRIGRENVQVFRQVLLVLATLGRSRQPGKADPAAKPDA